MCTRGRISGWNEVTFLEHAVVLHGSDEIISTATLSVIFISAIYYYLFSTITI
jgi:hypothetical protein